jgi:asparagine synthase (glutamine-hydrolysing)
VSALQPELKASVLHEDILGTLGGYDSLDVFREHYDRAGTDDPLSRIQYLDIKTYLTDDILAKVDRASMAHSLEVRAPLLDHELMELTASIPAALKLRGTNGKYILKKALGKILPDTVVQRKKMGFAVPLARWFRNELKDLAHDVIFTGGDDGLLDQATVGQLWREHQSGLRNRSTELWTLLMFRLWQRQFQQNRAGDAVQQRARARSLA